MKIIVPALLSHLWQITLNFIAEATLRICGNVGCSNLILGSTRRRQNVRIGCVEDVIKFMPMRFNVPSAKVMKINLLGCALERTICACGALHVFGFGMLSCAFLDLFEFGLSLEA
jgi:hypothetical protein